ncbi:copper chaperone PCu(A)C [Pseudomonas abieticivorans]|uniref:copper chaperone PCu(A)C n=1 Tax=Pseudomonas abieticivorans TaxID=2931382 RepID=UPI0020C07867|nr:copper chaperone PCu(A)C [Pseudomonas sp. PIA16]
MYKKVLVLLALMLPASLLMAQTFKQGDLQIIQPWSQELPPNAPTVAAYFVIRNDGNEADRLDAVSSPIAGTVEMHQHMDSDGMMKMGAVEGVNVAANDQVAFAPMGYHVMLMDLQEDRSQLVDGQHFPLTLHFEKAGDVDIEVDVHKQPPTDSQDHTAH